MKEKNPIKTRLEPKQRPIIRPLDSLPRITKRPTAGTGHTLEISVPLPWMRIKTLWILARKKRLRYPKGMYVVASLVGSAIILVILVLRVPPTAHPAKTTLPHRTTNAPQPRPMLSHGVPSYPTILPAGKGMQDLGGWTRISPPDRDPVYAYVDKIGNIQIDVSEQPLPASFQANTANAVAQLAQGFNADQKISTGSVKIYIATNSNSTQSVLLSKQGLLILIKSAGLIATNQWAAYVNSLQ